MVRVNLGGKPREDEFSSKINQLVYKLYQRVGIYVGSHA